MAPFTLGPLLEKSATASEGARIEGGHVGQGAGDGAVRAWTAAGRRAKQGTVTHLDRSGKKRAVVEGGADRDHRRRGPWGADRIRIALVAGRVDHHNP